MKYRKSTFVILLVLACAVMLASCQNDCNAHTDARGNEIVNEKQYVSLATYGIGPELENAVSGFNRTNPLYGVSIIDISQGGEVSKEDALSKFNTEVINGNAPDMVCFHSINPYPYISKRLLLDQVSLFEQDPKIKLHDLAVQNALLNNNELYYFSSSFVFETLVGKYTQFGPKYGWTLDEYLNIETCSSPGQQTIYNITAESFLNEVASRYTRTGIDWSMGTCDFNNEEFLSILESSKKIKETPENEDNLLFGPGGEFVGSGVLITALSWVTDIETLAEEETYAKCKLSFIGWPTPDGSCGTDAHLINPIGIFASSQNVDICWEFMKHLLTDNEAEYGIPMYMPRLVEQLGEAQSRTVEENPISPEYVSRFLGLLRSIENCAVYDDNVLGIIMKEAGPYLDGDKTAEEVLRLIQSKVSIYVSEQS